MFKKKFNHDDLYNYLPDNHTIGTAQFFKDKFHGKIDDLTCRYFEVKSRKECDDTDLFEILEEYKKEQNAIINEYDTIVNLSQPDNHYTLLREIKYKVKLYNE
jgi:hypothetical protein